jgi:hypothetical protein
MIYRIMSIIIMTKPLPWQIMAGVFYAFRVGDSVGDGDFRK